MTKFGNWRNSSFIPGNWLCLTKFKRSQPDCLEFDVPFVHVPVFIRLRLTGVLLLRVGLDFAECSEADLE